MKKPDECAWACCRNRALCEWDSAYNHQLMAIFSDPLWPAGQLFAEQQCAAVLLCPWTPSGLLWRGRCCWMEKKETMNVNGTFTGTSSLPAWPSSPGCGRVLDQPCPLFRQLGQDCHPSLVREGCGHGGKYIKQFINKFFKYLSKKKNKSCNNDRGTSTRKGDAEFKRQPSSKKRN